jgi:glycosyltransferase involved in cell wall biosynthesis
MRSPGRTGKLNLILDSVYPPLVGGVSTFTQSYLNSELSNVYNIIPVGYGMKAKNTFHFFLRETAVVVRLLKALIFGKSRIIQINSSAYVSFYRYSVHVLLAKLFRKKIVVRIGGSNFDRFLEDANTLAKSFIRFILRAADRVVVLTSYWQTFFREYGIETIIIPNAVSFDFEIHQNKEDLRKKFELPEKSFIGVFLGTVEQRKGILDLIEVARSLERENPDVLLIVLGEGPLLETLSSGPEDFANVKWIGRVEGEDKYAYLHLSDVLIFPSYAEGFPNAIVEAMSMGLPVVASDIPPVRDIVKQGENGIFFKTGDIPSLKGAITYCCNHKAQCEGMGRTNRDRVKTEFHWDIIWRYYDDIYKELLKA